MTKKNGDRNPRKVWTDTEHGPAGGPIGSHVFSPSAFFLDPGNYKKLRARARKRFLRDAGPDFWRASPRARAGAIEAAEQAAIDVMYDLDWQARLVSADNVADAVAMVVGYCCPGPVADRDRRGRTMPGPTRGPVSFQHVGPRRQPRRDRSDRGGVGRRCPRIHRRGWHGNEDACRGRVWAGICRCLQGGEGLPCNGGGNGSDNGAVYMGRWIGRARMERGADPVSVCEDGPARWMANETGG
jgi:hypothetical protein